MSGAIKITVYKKGYHPLIIYPSSDNFAKFSELMWRQWQDGASKIEVFILTNGETIIFDPPPVYSDHMLVKYGRRYIVNPVKGKYAPNRTIQK